MKILLKKLIGLYWLFTLLQATRIGPIIKNALRRENFEHGDYNNKISYSYGYPIEHHDVITKDGYILSLNRILSNSSNPCNPVYLFHGLLESSEIFMVSGPGRALAFLLSDKGYDVWLGNARGTTNSRRHMYLKPHQRKFWDFTWHEIGIYDNPANIDYILEKTNQEKLHYVGHSQGTTTFFVMMSLFPEYNKKIKTMHALAPVTYMKYTTSPFFTLQAPYIDLINRLTLTLGLEEYFPNTHFFSILQRFCKVKNLNLNLCYRILAVGGGMNQKQIDTENLYRFFEFAPAGASIFQALHYSQLYLNGKFQSYDYGIAKNLLRYKQKYPIEYPLHRVTADSIYLYVSGNDLISNIEDIKTLISRLPKKPNYIEVADKEWTHFDYLIAKDAKKIIYDSILNHIHEADKLNCDTTRI